MAAVDDRSTLRRADRARASSAAASAAPCTGSDTRLYAGRCSQLQPSNHPGWSAAAASSVPTPRSVSIERSAPLAESETTTPVWPPITGPTSSTPRLASSLATSAAAGSSASAAISLLLPPSAATHAATFAA